MPTNITGFFFEKQKRTSVLSAKTCFSKAVFDVSTFTFFMNSQKYQGVKEFHMLARIGCFKNYGFQSF